MPGAAHASCELACTRSSRLEADASASMLRCAPWPRRRRWRHQWRRRSATRLERLPAHCERPHGALCRPPAPFHARETPAWSRAAAAQGWRRGCAAVRWCCLASFAARLRRAHGLFRLMRGGASPYGLVTCHLMRDHAHPARSTRAPRRRPAYVACALHRAENWHVCAAGRAPQINLARRKWYHMS